MEDDVVFGLENAGVPPEEMRARVEEVFNALEIDHLRRRPLATLSGGEMQRVAIAGALVLRPRALVLDEPTSQLAPRAAEDLLALLVRLNRELGLTIVLAEHRLERVAQYAHRVLYVPGRGKPPILGPPQAVFRHVSLAPPVVRLGRRLSVVASAPLRRGGTDLCPSPRGQPFTGRFRPPIRKRAGARRDP
ncbi:MAG: ATP-binding cassette domain-containing protein [Ardenticatenia bacterium]|nr:ATP-binding cassette domain-containing protein [Ardenticatenia bacterium]